jgi:hypothetical protein
LLCIVNINDAVFGSFIYILPSMPLLASLVQVPPLYQPRY